MTDNILTPTQAFDIADSMQAAAAAVQAKRREQAKAGPLDPADFDALIKQETALRYDADRYRAVGITLLTASGAITATSLVQAIDEATDAISKINELKKILNIAAGLVSLGVAIASGNVQTISAQIDALEGVLSTG